MADSWSDEGNGPPQDAKKVEVAVKHRDVLSELKSIAEHLHGLMGPDDLPGRAANRIHLDAALADFLRVAENIVGLEGEYARGVTAHQRLEASYGSNLRTDQTHHLFGGGDPDAQQRKIEDLQRQIEALKGGQQ